MTSFKISSPGKLHIIGEHSVVYGKPAILSAVNKRCFCEISERQDKDILIVSEDLQSKMQISQDIILERTKNAREGWKQFMENNNISQLNQLIADPLNLIVFAIGETLLFNKKNADKGFNLNISCEIPIGIGMGSSAAIATSVISAVFLFLGKELDLGIVNSISYLVEERIHGNPSGGDNAACCFGGFLWFRKESPELKIIQRLPFSLPEELKKKFLIFLTGRPKETTGEMVSSLRVLYGKKPKFVEAILQDQESLAREMIGSLKRSDSEEIIGIIKKAQRNLQSLEVVSSSTAQLIRKIEVLGGAAKICGAGGVKGASGVVLAFHDDPQMLLDTAKKAELVCEHISLGEEGVRME